MLLNRLEYTLMNNPFRAALQRYGEARQLLRMGGPTPGAKALEVGCGRGIGVAIILDAFQATRVDAFDLDPRMIAVAARRLHSRSDRMRLWQGDATSIQADDATYDAVFVFGVIHHVPEWRSVVKEVFRVLKPGGRLYAEEAFARLITASISQLFFRHPQNDRFEFDDFISELEIAGFKVVASKNLIGLFGWFVADKP